MAQKSKGRISIANILALIGLAAIGVITFFGKLIQNADGKPGSAIIWAIIVIAILGGLLALAIKAKGAEDNPDKWKYVEWSSIALYVVAAVFLASSFLSFFYVASNKDSLSEKARAEVSAIEKMYAQYDHQQKTHIDRAAEQFKNYIDSKQDANVDPSLTEYVNETVKTNVDSWKSNALSITKRKPDDDLKNIKNMIANWNPMELASIAKELEDRDSLAWENLNKKIVEFGAKNKLIPVISGGIGGYYLDGYAKFDLGNPPVAEFAKELRESKNKSNTAGWVVYAILNVLILLNWLVAPTGTYVAPTSRNSGTGGLSL